MLNVSKKIVYSELVITAILFSTLIPYIIYIMDFHSVVLFHYVNVTLLILAPVGFGLLYYFIVRWECRPIDTLSFYLERNISPPDDIMAAARIRMLNLPFIHSITLLIRYEIMILLTCLYMGLVGELPATDAVRLGLYASIGLFLYPIFSFFLTERLLYPVRQILAEKTAAVRIDESKIIWINTRTRLFSILVAAVIGPLFALSVLLYNRLGEELNDRLGSIAYTAYVQPVLSPLFQLSAVAGIIALFLAAGISILLATGISTPLVRMLKTIREVEKGNLRARTNLISNDEIGVLSHSFDDMTLNLEKSRGELEDLNRNLESRVIEKTENLTRAYERLQQSNQNLAIANRELGTANIKLRELDRIKSNFISVVSHELRTPLTSIKAFAELFLMKPNMPLEKRNKLLHIINDESDRLTRLINEVLDLTKIEAGKMSWHIAQLSTDDIVETSVSGIRSLSDNKGLTITVQLRHPLPFIFGDRDRLIQVLNNILSNAINFTPPGGEIRVSACYEEAPKSQIVVEVSDTGIGIRKEDLEIIFEKFHRSEDILLNHPEGAGLGLAISRLIVEYHGGAIWAKSRPGEGSTFTFTLPLNKSWQREDHQAILEDFEFPHSSR